MSPNRKPFPAQARGLAAFCLLFGFFALPTPFPVHAASERDAVHELAMKVCGFPHKTSVRILWQESPAAAGYWSDSNKKTFLEQISACGIAASESLDAAVLRVTLQVTPSRMLLVADASDGSNGQLVRMVEIPRGSELIGSEAAPGPRLRSELIWQQPEPIAGAIEWQDVAIRTRMLFLLTDGRVVRIGFENGTPRMVDSAAVPGLRKRSRLAEGRIVSGRAGGSLQVLLGDGKACGFDPAAQEFALTCDQANVADEPAQISSKCEERPRYLATSNRDYSQPDRIVLRGVVSDREPVAQGGESDSVEVPGPVLALSVAENRKAAFAVVRNLSTGSYEVYRITAVCGD